MTAAVVHKIAHRTFLTLPFCIMVGFSSLYPYVSEYWEPVRNITLAFYMGALVFLSTASFELDGESARVIFLFPAWVAGIVLTLTSFAVATGLQLLFDVPFLLQILF
jgi:hypothetical protein